MVAVHLLTLGVTFHRWSQSSIMVRQGWRRVSQSPAVRAQASSATSSAKREREICSGIPSSMSLT